MKHSKKFLKVILLFIIAMNVILCSMVQAKTPDGYTLMKDTTNVKKDTTLEQSTPVTFKLDFSACNGYTYTTSKNMIVEDKGYLCYTLPNENITNVDETLTITYPNAATNWAGTKFDLRIIINNLTLNNYHKSKGKNKNLRLFTTVDNVPWVEGYLASGSFSDIFDGLNYDVTMQIIDKSGNVQSGTFVYAVKDIDISSKFGYGDYSEGVTLKSGFDLSTLKVKTNSILCCKTVNGNIRITGTTSNDYTDRNASASAIDAAEETGFSVIANASGTKFNWTSGKNCGTALCDFGQPEKEKLIPNTPTIVVKYLEEGTLVELHTLTTAKPGTSVSKIDINDYTYTGVQLDNGGKGQEPSIVAPNDNNSHTIIFWYKKAPKINIVVKYLEEGTNAELHTSTTTAPGSSVDKIDINDYTYTGVQLDNGGKGQEPSIVAPNDNNSHTIIFWYKKAPKINIVVKYLEEGTNAELHTSTTTAPGSSVAKIDIGEYAYTGVQLDAGVKGLETSVVAPNDNNSHTIIFWYKRFSKVTVRYVVIKNATDSFSKGTDVITPKTILLDADKTFNSSQISETGRNYDYVGVTVDGGSQTKDTKITIINDWKNHEIVFAYVQTVNVKVIGVCLENEKVKQFTFEQNVSVPINKTYKASSYKWQGYKLIEGNNTRVIAGTLAWIGQGPDKTGGEAKVAVTASSYSNATKNILVVFYYESNYKATVKHIYVNPLTKEETILETGTISITPDVNKTILSKKFSNYINLAYEANPNVTLTPNGFEKYSDKVFNVSFVPGEENYTIEFRYTSQVIEVRHEYSDGTPVKPPVTKILDPNEPEGPVPSREAVYYQLNSDSKKDPDTIKIPVKPGQEKQTLVFVYTSPYLIFGDEDPNPDHPYYPEGKKYTDMKKKYNAGIFPNKMNNQLIGQSDSAYYWVLDEKGELTIRLAYKHMTSGTVTCSASVKIPFDVYINGVLTTANTPINVSIRRIKENDDGCDVWEGKLSNIMIPIWTQEKEYSIEATVPYTHTATDGYITSIKGVGTVKVTVIGAVYDFSITNIDGSNTTGDAMWKASLITNPILASAKKSNGAVEYETNILPIGQANQQNAKYSYGIKKGTRFYFSVNTKGSKSTSIEITPKFYYFDKAGNIGNNGNPVTVRSGNTDITALTRTTSLTDANRTTAEYQKELSSGKTLYGANTYGNAKPTVFANKVITIGTGLRTPFVNYGKDPTSTKYHEISVLTDTNRVYRNASHWYADYVIPNNAIFYDSSNKQLPADGFVVVGFSIRTKAGNDAYLAYSLYSPFTATKQSEWAYEGAPANYTLPKTLSLTSGKATTPWLRNVVNTVNNPQAFAPVAIYQFSAGNPGTMQNVDSTGTH